MQKEELITLPFDFSIKILYNKSNEIKNKGIIVMQDIDKIKLLIDQLNIATKAYDEGNPIMTDKEWDDLYFSLKAVERETGIILPNSPTQKVIYQVVNKLNKKEHDHAMLSLDKTKDLKEIKEFLGDQPWVAMLKLDGLSCSLTYENGQLVAAETRGNGEVGEDVLHNALVIKSIPNRIPFYDRLVVDGEIICTKADFEDFKEEYKNPRNFASGSIRLLDSKECEARKLSFIVWDVIEGLPDEKLFSSKLQTAEKLGFYVVPTLLTKGQTLEEVTSVIQQVAEKIGYPIDGVVFKFDDVEYGQSLGRTSHHFKNAIAYKFYDETYETRLLDIEWTMGRTGVLTPVAVFEPIDMDGSIVERASLHNVSVMQTILGPRPWIGQKVRVFKANMIIPQIEWAEEAKDDEDHNEIPMISECPICGHGIKVTENSGSIFAICDNPNCEGKFINKLDHFCSKKGLDIKGISKATLSKLIDWGWVNCLSDIFKLNEHRAEWISKPGFGAKSVDKILESIQAASFTTLEQFISSLGIPLIGQNVSKELVKKIPTYEEFREKADSHFDFGEYPGFAGSKTLAIWNYDFTEADKVYKFLILPPIGEKEEEPLIVNSALEGVTVCITGKLETYKNRAALQKDIELYGDKVTSSVSKNTDYLINNDNTSTSSKNLTAQKLGVPIITEKEFIQKFLLTQ